MRALEILQKAKEKRSKKLNKIEKLKQEVDAFRAWEKLKEYAKLGYDAIPNEDKSFFLKCFGIYDRPKTPKRFMLKLRIPAGHLNAKQARVIGECAKDFGQDYIDLTTRMQCELRYLKIEDLPEILERLNEVGINSYQTGVDNIRGIMGDPFDALAYDNILPSHHYILKMQEIFLQKKEWVAKIPRKFNSVITGNIVNRCNAFVHDLCFVLAQKDGEYGYNLYLGGKVGKIAKNANIFVRPNEVLAAFEAVIKLFKEFGFRDNRNKNRLWFLIEEVGIEVIKKAICKLSGIDFEEAGETLTKLHYNEPQNGKIALKDGTYAIHAVVPSGIFSGSALIEAARLSEAYGNKELRFSMEQSIYILGVKDTKTLLKEDFFKKYKNISSPYFNNLIACAGTQHCPFGVIENKNDAMNLASFLEKEVPLPSHKRVRFYWSACVKGCGIHGLGDIGFEGCKAKLNGKSVPGVHISIGGKLVDKEGVEGKKLLQAVPLEIVPEYIKSLMLEFKEKSKPKEHLESFLDRIMSEYSLAFIRFIMKLNALLRQKGFENAQVGFELNTKSTKQEEEKEIFELAKLLYFKLSNERPFASEVKNVKVPPIEKFNPKVSKNIALFLEKALEINEAKRPKVFSEIEKIIFE